MLGNHHHSAGMSHELTAAPEEVHILVLQNEAVSVPGSEGNDLSRQLHVVGIGLAHNPSVSTRSCRPGARR